MAEKKSHMETCLDLMLTYKRFFDKYNVIYAQMLSGRFVIIVKGESGNQYPTTFKSYSDMVDMLDRAVEDKL